MPYVDSGHQALAEARIALHEGRYRAVVAVANVPPALQHDAGLLYELAREPAQSGRLSRGGRRSRSAAGGHQPAGPDVAGAGGRRHDARCCAATCRSATAWPPGHQATDGRPLPMANGSRAGSPFVFSTISSQSYTHFTGLYTGVTSPISKARGAYWAGRAAEEMGDLATAQNWYRAAGVQSHHLLRPARGFARRQPRCAAVRAPCPSPARRSGWPSKAARRCGWYACWRSSTSRTGRGPSCRR